MAEQRGMTEVVTVAMTGVATVIAGYRRPHLTRAAPSARRFTVTVTGTVIGPEWPRPRCGDRGIDLWDVHLRACADRDADELWWQSADVLYYDRPTHVGQVVARLRGNPGCAVCTGASSTGQLVLAARRGTRIQVVQARAGAPASGDRCALIGSIVHAWMAAGYPPETLDAIELPGGCPPDSIRMRAAANRRSGHAA